MTGSRRFGLKPAKSQPRARASGKLRPFEGGAAETLESLRERAAEQGFTALVMHSPVTGNPYLHVQRYVRSPLRKRQKPEVLVARVAGPSEDAEATAPVELPAAVVAPRPLPSSRLDFPRRLLRTKVDGRIVLLLEVSEEGRVVDLAVDSSDLPEFEDFVANEVRRWRFTPPTREGRPVAAAARLPIPIRIH